MIHSWPPATVVLLWLGTATFSYRRSFSSSFRREWGRRYGSRRTRCIPRDRPVVRNDRPKTYPRLAPVRWHRALPLWRKLYPRFRPADRAWSVKRLGSSHSERPFGAFLGR